MSIVLIEKQELADLIKTEVKQAVGEILCNQLGTNLYTINQVAKKIGRSHKYVKRAVDSGLLQTNETGLISERELQKFINGK